MEENNLIPKIILGGGVLFLVLCIASCFIPFKHSAGVICGMYAALYVGWVFMLILLSAIKKEWSLTKQGLVSFYIIISIIVSILFLS